jgi:hypothetical protein
MNAGTPEPALAAAAAPRFTTLATKIRQATAKAREIVMIRTQSAANGVPCA